MINCAMQPIKCVSLRENLALVQANKKKKHRQSYASMQPDQRLCYFLSKVIDGWSCYMPNSNILPSLCSWADQIELCLVDSSKERFLRRDTNIRVHYVACIKLLFFV